MKNKIAFLLFVVVYFSGVAQPRIEFLKNTHDFGYVVEGEKPIYTFEFENIGTDTLILQSVKPGCGCTSPSWSKDPIAPGDVGEITVTYNSKGRLGTFSKPVNVSSNASNPRMILNILGLVGKVDASEEVPTSQVNLDKKKHHFGKIQLNKISIATFEITNLGADTLKIGEIRTGCNCISGKLSRESGILAGKKGISTLSYKPSYIGEVNHKVFLFVNDNKNERIELELSADVVRNIVQPNLLQQNSGFGF